MKKFMYLGAAALAGLFATSCASDEPAAGTTDGMTTFTVQMPEDLTRAFGEGTDAKTLCVAIYENGKQEAPLFTNFGGNDNLNGMKITPGESLKWTVSVPLVKGKAYDIVCWAQSYANTDKTVYEYDETARTITVNYENMANYAEARDAFFGNTTYTSNGNGETIKLYRPFAQINVLTSDYQAFKYGNGTSATDPDPNTFGIEVKGVANVVNIFDGTIAPAADDNTATVLPAAVQEGKTVTKGEGDAAVTTTYNYLAMAYVLAGTNATNGKSVGGTVDVALNVNGDAKFANYPNVPVRANYRTNIYGQLLTNSEVFNVEILPGFGTPDNDYYVAVKDAAGLESAVAAGKAPVLQNDIEIEKIPTDANGNAAIELNNNKLTVKNRASIAGNLSIKNGEIAVDDNYNTGYAIIDLNKGASVNLDNVTTKNDNDKLGFVASFTPKASWADKEGSITINNCNLSSHWTVFSTNASNASTFGDVTIPYTITINNSTFSGLTGVCLNVPCKLVMNNCNVTGTAQALVVRGGTAELNNCKFTTTCNPVTPYTFANYNWGNGTHVPLSAMTVGNNKTYNFPIDVTATGCTFNVNNTAGNAIKQLWLDAQGNQKINVPCVYAMKGVDATKDVTINLNGCTFNGNSGEDYYIFGEGAVVNKN